MAAPAEKSSLQNLSDVLITLDIDWAPDWMIADAASYLREAGVRATWFATHKSSVVKELSEDKFFELGAHPNFLSGSSHGVTPDEVLRCMRDWFPEARAIRTHSLFQSEPLLALIADQYGFETDCSVFLPGAVGVQPYRIKLTENGRFLTRLPHIFQDNMHAINGGSWSASAGWLPEKGLRVLNFHPVHIALNTNCLATYEAFKLKGALRDARREDNPANNTSPGAGTLFREIVEALKGARTDTVSSYVDRWVVAGDGVGAR